MPLLQLLIVLAGAFGALQTVPATVQAIKTGKAKVEEGAQTALLYAGGALLLLAVLVAAKK